MARSARSPEPYDEPQGLLMEGLTLSARAVSQNPVTVGCMTAFAITLFYVSANALWNQPHFHSGAFFQTRVIRSERVDPPPTAETGRFDQFQPAVGVSNEPVNSIPVPTPGSPQYVPSGDPKVFQVQKVLAELGLYGDHPDGLNGPKTRAAVANYRQIVGLGEGGAIDDALLRQLGISFEQIRAPGTEAAPGGAVPQPSVRPAETRVASADSARIVRIQAGLKAFGNDAIVIDGIPGTDTRAAIREFQALFGLPVTGEPDETLYAKMKEVGLTD